MKLSTLKKKAKEFNVEKVATHRSKNYYAFQQQLITIFQTCYNKHKDDKSIKKPSTLIYGSAIDAFAYEWLKSQQQYILNDSVAELLSKIEIKTKDATAKIHKLPDNLSKRYAKNEQIANKNKRHMFKKFNINVFNKPKEQTVHTVSSERSEFSQYMNEPVHLLGKIKRMSKDKDVTGNVYTKLLLINVQYFPTNPRYMFKKALFLPDHIWIDITDPSVRDLTYQINDYVGFSGVVGEYQSKVNRHKSQIKHHHIDYWRTKYNLMDPHFEQEGTPIIDDNNMISELKFTNRSEDVIIADQLHISKNLKGN